MDEWAIPKMDGQGIDYVDDGKDCAEVRRGVTEILARAYAEVKTWQNNNGLPKVFSLEDAIVSAENCDETPAAVYGMRARREALAYLCDGSSPEGEAMMMAIHSPETMSQDELVRRASAISDWKDIEVALLGGYSASRDIPDMDFLDTLRS